MVFILCIVLHCQLELDGTLKQAICKQIHSFPYMSTMAKTWFIVAYKVMVERGVGGKRRGWSLYVNTMSKESRSKTHLE